MTVTEFLHGKVPFLEGLTEDQAHYLAKSAEQKPFTKGQTVIFQGATVDGLHVVASGKASVYVRPSKSKEPALVAELAPGDVFGEASISEFTVASATVKSAADDTLIFVIPEIAFQKILATDDDLKSRTLALIEQRKEARKPKPKEKQA